MGVHVIKRGSDEQSFAFCKRWLTAADSLRAHLHDEGERFDPFRYNETATVGFLVAAAGRARMLALPEFTEDCKNLPEGRVRAGRCDLWLASEDWKINWLLEFKQRWYGPGSRRGLVTSLNDAIKCAVDRDKREANVRWAVRGSRRSCRSGVLPRWHYGAGLSIAEEASWRGKVSRATSVAQRYFG